MVGHEALALPAGVLTAAIRVMQQRIRLTPPPDCHQQCVGDQLGRHRRAHRPAHHTSREEINDRRHIEPPFRPPDIRKVSNPLQLGAEASKVCSRRFGATAATCRLPRSGGIRAGATAITIEIGGVVVRVAPGVDPAWLRAVEAAHDHGSGRRQG